MHSLAVTYFRELQDRICANIERVDGGTRFREDSWEREGGGGGRSRILENSTVFEKAGVNFSEVFGEMDAAFANHLPGEGTRFTATGISLVLHPRSPHIPTVHANFRFLTRGSASWFGGGADLTPVLDKRRTQEDADTQAFHAAFEAACTGHAIADYPRYKQWCDEYFYLPHRKEMRGVGGIFYDHLTPGEAEGGYDAAFAFTRDVGRAFRDIYPTLVRRSFATPWTDADREEQLVRRGRYVEFNLLYDRGTLFGLKTGGNVDSILSSMPPMVRWP